MFRKIVKSQCSPFSTGKHTKNNSAGLEIGVTFRSKNRNSKEIKSLDSTGPGSNIQDGRNMVMLLDRERTDREGICISTAEASDFLPSSAPQQLQFVILQRKIYTYNQSLKWACLDIEDVKKL